jgi:hypothetical protein
MYHQMDHQVVLRCRGALCAKKKEFGKEQIPEPLVVTVDCDTCPAKCGATFHHFSTRQSQKRGGHASKTRESDTS